MPTNDVYVPSNKETLEARYVILMAFVKRIAKRPFTTAPDNGDDLSDAARAILERFGKV